MIYKVTVLSFSNEMTTYTTFRKRVTAIGGLPMTVVVTLLYRNVHTDLYFNSIGHKYSLSILNSCDVHISLT